MTFPLLPWLPVIALPLGALLLMPASIPAWGAMWLLAINVFAGVKWLSWATVRKSVSRAADWQRDLKSASRLESRGTYEIFPQLW